MTVKELKVNNKVYEPFIENIREHQISSIRRFGDLNHVGISFVDGNYETEPAQQHVNSTKVVFKERYSSSNTTAYTTIDKARKVQRQKRLDHYLWLKENAVSAREKADNFFIKYLND